jgi:transposase
MEGSIIWVGIDAHKKTLVVAVFRPGGREADEFTVENTATAIKKFVRRLVKDARGREIRACYEAGTCGFTLQRRIEAAGAVVCEVVAPSLIPRKPGDRIKTDRRDAKKLAELYRAGALTMVSPPTMEQEAIRDLCRCREDARIDLTRCRHRLVKMLVRRGHVFAGTSRLWSVAHRKWLDTLAFDDELDRITVEQYKLAIDQVERRLRGLDAQLERAADLPLYRDSVSRLRCFHGIDTIVAMIFVAEVYGIERFDSPRKLAAYLGLVPSLSESGGRGRSGPITKTGNKHVRRVLLQAAWLYMRRSTTSRAVRNRREGQPEEVVGIAEAAKTRLTARFHRLLARGKNRNKVVIAIMRELVGFLWAALRVPTKAARHGARSPTLIEGVEASAAPRSIAKTSRSAVGQRRKARKEKRAA